MNSLIATFRPTLYLSISFLFFILTKESFWTGILFSFDILVNLVTLSWFSISITTNGLNSICHSLQINKQHALRVYHTFYILTRQNDKTLIFNFFSGEHGGYSRNSHHPSVSSVYSTLPHVQMVSASNGYPVRISNGVRLSATELDLDTYSPSLTTPIVIETNQQNTNEGPICASSPKRSMSAFTTFGQNRSNVTTPMSPTGPASGHLV